MEVDADTATLSREIDGGKETMKCALPMVVAGQKGLVEEKDLRIPNMRGIMMARQKPMSVLEPAGFQAATSSVKFEKPAPKGACKMIRKEDLDALIDALHIEA